MLPLKKPYLKKATLIENRCSPLLPYSLILVNKGIKVK
jgi:hypothetical protein